MRPDLPPDWLNPPNLAAARLAQQALAALVVAEDRHGEVRRIAGVDVSNTRFDPESRVHAGIVVLSWPELEKLDEASAVQRAAMPYIPGFLGFREVPALLEAWGKLSLLPDLLLVDGHGIAHPRGLGIAAHLGVVLDVPSIGVAKSPLVGRPAAPLGEAPGATAPLEWQGRQLGTVLRTRARANPLYVSVGHRVSLAGALGWVRRCGRGYRLPEPTRLAHLAANAARRAAG
ncbi:deoxyribonuclease V [Siccirubricoccus phaeus]|uniref:deoxyribonuclease V n=1 Tax=Siccirubricoccus phaeus TaxID=2595053 RepID=UPI0011F27B68|nr:deoxyribonuclease V [Siccirubricoccus phaeus]